MISNEGLWLFCNPGDYYGPPSLIRIEDDIIQNYKFISKKDVIELKLEYTGRTAETFSQVQSEFISVNRMRLHVPYKRYISSGNDSVEVTETIISIKQYEKLKPTYTHFTIEEISTLKFSLSWIKKGSFISFGEDLDTDVMQDINKHLKKKGCTMYLQKFENTYFLAFWDDDTFEGILPIIEIDKSKVVVSGFTTFPYERIGYIFS